VLERQVYEHTLQRPHGAVVALRERVLRDVQRQRIGGKGARRATEHVARELIEQNDQRQAIARLVFPVRELAGGGLAVEREEARADLGVEGRALFEPALIAVRTTEPESDDLRSLRVFRFHKLQ